MINIYNEERERGRERVNRTDHGRINKWEGGKKKGLNNADKPLQFIMS